MNWNRDRDFDDVPDWQEDENYADEAPLRGPNSPRARMPGSGCALPVALLAALGGRGAPPAPPPPRRARHAGGF
jgi:hypothetical protein